MVGDSVHMVRHRDAFLDSLTDEEYAIHEEQVNKGTIDKVMQILRSRDPAAAAAQAEREQDEQNTAARDDRLDPDPRAYQVV